MGKMFKSKQSTPQFDIAADPYGSIRQPTLEWLRGQIGKPAEQYKGEMVAESTPQEKQSLDFLKGYVDSPTSESSSLARAEVKKTMENQYDPTSSPYYQAAKAEAARNLELAQKNIASHAAGAGRYWSGARLKEQGTASNDAAIAMNKLLYGMAETERSRRASMVPIAAQIGQIEQEEPLKKATALQQLGSLERVLQQARNEAIYDEWLRATQEYPLQIGSMAAGLSREPYYVQRTKQAAPIMQTMGSLGSMIPNAIATYKAGLGKKWYS